MLTEEQKNRFLFDIFHSSVITPGSIDSVKFYNLFYEFIEKENLVQEGEDSDELDLIENELFKIACQRGYINLIAVTTVLKEDIKDFLDKNILKKENRILHIKIYEGEDEMSLIDYWKKWDDSPPQGWIADYCSCGSIDPITNDICLFAYSNKENIPHPVSIKVDEIEKIDLMSNNSMRFTLNNGVIYKVLLFNQVSTLEIEST